jgi:hypothetical protein
MTRFVVRSESKSPLCSLRGQFSSKELLFMRCSVNVDEAGDVREKMHPVGAQRAMIPTRRFSHYFQFYCCFHSN